MRAVVVGSLNMDLVLEVPELPRRGQTLLSRSLDRLPGGKGANQAVAGGHPPRRAGDAHARRGPAAPPRRVTVRPVRPRPPRR